MNNANISPADTTPLYDTETEQALLGTLFIGRSGKDGKTKGQAAYIATKAAGLKAEHFYRQEHRRIYEVAEKTFNAGQMIDIVIATQELQEKIPGIISLLTLITQKVDFIDNAVLYAKRLIDLAERRNIVAQAERLKANAANLEISPTELKQETLLAMADQGTTAGDTAMEPTCNDVMQLFSSSQEAPCYSTGFKELDKILDGGLYPGLYIVGAISSLGKTSLCLQIGDNIAAHGQDVLVFSLEMSKKELISKSLSRIMAQHDKKNAKTTRAIMRGSNKWNSSEKALFLDAITEYTEGTGSHLYIHVGMGNIGPNEIRAAVIQHQIRTGNYPVVIVDYVQILAPSDIRATDKQNMDKAVLELKRISRDYNTPVIGISSFNRDNYTAPVNMAAFKESGSLEYSSDVLIGLQYTFMEKQDNEREAARAARIAEESRKVIAAAKEGKAIAINARILKNRNGAKGSAYLEFTPMFNEFRDIETLQGSAANDHEINSLLNFAPPTR